SKIYHKNISFNDFRRVYNLDKQISKELYKQLALVELALSSSISYHLSKSYFGNFSTITSDLNTFYLDISHYSIPNQNSGPAHLINYFYNYDIQKQEVYNSHKFFKKYV
ncbi:Abi family protein, partial [Streptococcus suis]